MICATALPTVWDTCSTSPMLSGAELGMAIAAAMELKRVGPTEVAREFGIKQPSVSEWKTHGRIAKRHIPKLLSYFGDVCGPDHWGLPFTKEEFDAILLFRQLPVSTRTTLLIEMRKAAEQAGAMGHALTAALTPPPQKPHRQAA